jgi:hypothetical protein
MTWFNVIKLDREERIRGILSNWLDEVLDWLETVESEAVDLKNNLDSSFDEIQEIIDSQPEHLKEIFRAMLPMSKEEAIQTAQAAIDEIDPLRESIRQMQEVVDSDIPILGLLNMWKESQLIEPIMTIGEDLKSDPPTPPNLDRLMGQLELGEGYEE